MDEEQVFLFASKLVILLPSKLTQAITRNHPTSKYQEYETTTQQS